VLKDLEENREVQRLVCGARQKGFELECKLENFLVWEIFGLGILVENFVPGNF
jgi:hypothetical protein